MALPKISIVLTCEKRETFHPGEEISGSVIIGLDKPLEIRNVHLTFRGKDRHKCVQHFTQFRPKLAHIKISAQMLDAFALALRYSSILLAILLVNIIYPLFAILLALSRKVS